GTPGEAAPIAEEELKKQIRFPFQRLAMREERKPEPISLEDVLDLRSLVVLGDPGTGKSTLLRWIARSAAKGLLGQLHPDIPPRVGEALRDRVPILVHARLLADHPPATDRDPAVTLAAAVARGSGVARLLESRLRAGRCLVLVDGLDEIPSAEARERTRSVIEGLAHSHSGNHILATSRIIGYDLVRLGSPFEHVTLADLDDDAIREFALRWYRTIFRASPAPGDTPERRAEILFDAIENHPGIRRIAGNPLLLTIIALIHWRGGRLPARRVEVYEAATRTLLDNWLARRPWARLNVDEMIPVLSGIAFAMHETGETGLIPASRLRQLFCERLAEARFTSAEAVRGEVDHLVTTLSQHSGLFLERGIADDGEILYGFLHLTFQEYLAALHLFQAWTAWVTAGGGGRPRSGKAKENPVHPYLFDPRWQEVVLLAAGRASETNEALAATFVRGIAAFRDQYESLLRRGLLLAARVLGDDVRVDKASAQDICRALVMLLAESKIRSHRAATLGTIGRLAGTIYASLIGDELLMRLEDSDADVRWGVTSGLGGLRDPRALGPLCRRLEDTEARVRGAAAEALGALKDPRALEPLLRMLGDGEMLVEWAAAEALGALKDPRALEPLVELLGAPAANVRYAAARALGALKDPRALEPLLKQLKDEDWHVLVGVAGSLGVLKDSRALEPLLKQLEDENWYVRWKAAQALRTLRDSRALEPLLKRLEDENWHVRAEVVRALGVLKDPRALEPLLKRLEDEDSFVRAVTAQALGDLKDPRAFGPLLKRLGDPYASARGAAARALGALKDPRALEAT
ncbi:MAG: HEAT repeat domain-containing protein, partial [Deltaproteobacteria bacterium]|nr:HEAT repeat domain-containing protein [Deltaproteobacteria bacterium]